MSSNSVERITFSTFDRRTFWRAKMSFHSYSLPLSHNFTRFFFFLSLTPFGKIFQASHLSDPASFFSALPKFQFFSLTFHMGVGVFWSRYQKLLNLRFLTCSSVKERESGSQSRRRPLFRGSSVTCSSGRAAAVSWFAHVYFQPPSSNLISYRDIFGTVLMSYFSLVNFQWNWMWCI